MSSCVLHKEEGQEEARGVALSGASRETSRDRKMEKTGGDGRMESGGEN